MAEVNYYLRDKKSDKKTAVMMFFSYHNKRFKVGTVEHIIPKFWDSDNQRAKQTKTFANYPEFNTRLKKISEDVLDVYRKYLNDNEQQQPSTYQLKELINTKLNPTTIQPPNLETNLLGFTELFIADTESGKRLSEKGTPIQSGTIKVYKTLKKNLTQFKSSKKHDLNFENIGLAFFEDFKEYMTFELRYSTNTIAKHVRTLKTVINEAIERGLTKTAFTGKRYKAISEKTETIYLNKDELQRIFELNLSKNNRLERVRDLFLIGCWTGLRFSDFNDISPKDIKTDRFEIRTRKTGKGVVVPFHAHVKDIMNKYEGKTINSLPPTISNQKMNEYLKEIGELAELNDIVSLKFTKAGREVMKNIPKFSLISSHTARRSFATNMYLDNFPTISIMAITGHTTESSFMKYIRVTPTEHAEKLMLHWNRDLLRVV